MSRVGKYPVILKDGVTAEIKDNIIIARGKKGELKFNLPSPVDVKIEDNKIIVTPKNKTIEATKLWGTIRATINNMVVGVSEGFSRELLITGVGYRASLDNKKLKLQLGFTEDVIFPVPECIEINCPEPTRIVLTGINKQEVTHTASKIRAFKKPEPYKGKGIRYSNEVILRKEGKKK